MSDQITLVDQEVKSLGFNLKAKVPSSIEDYDRLAKKSGAALESAILNVVYRSVLAGFRDSFTEKVAEMTKIERKTKETGKTRKVKTEKADGTIEESVENVVVWDETESEYFDRVVATIATSEGKTQEEVRASLQSLADEVIAGIAFDPSETAEKSTGPKKVAKTYYEVADAIITAGKAELVAAALSAKLNRTVASDRESLARAVSDDQALKRKELAAGYIA